MEMGGRQRKLAIALMFAVVYRRSAHAAVRSTLSESGNESATGDTNEIAVVIAAAGEGPSDIVAHETNQAVPTAIEKEAKEGIVNFDPHRGTAALTVTMILAPAGMGEPSSCQRFRCFHRLGRGQEQKEVGRMPQDV